MGQGRAAGTLCRPCRLDGPGDGTGEEAGWGIGEVRWTSPLRPRLGRAVIPSGLWAVPALCQHPQSLLLGARLRPPPCSLHLRTWAACLGWQEAIVAMLLGGAPWAAVWGCGGVGSTEQGGGHRLEGVCVVPGGQGRACQSPRAPPRPKQTRAAARGQRALGLPRKERLGSYGGPISQFVHLRPVHPWACPSLGPSHAGPGPSMPILP